MKWKQQDATVCIFGTVNCAFGENTSDARRIVAEHNADCDAYESQIQELHARQTEVLRYFDEAYLASKSDVETNTVLEIYKAIRAIIDDTGAPEPSAGGTQP